MLTNDNQFEIVYQPLTAPESPLAALVHSSRARTSMVESRCVRDAAAPVFFARTADGAGFAVRSADRNVLESLPLSYGSPIGHFGVFQRGGVSVRQ